VFRIYSSAEVEIAIEPSAPLSRSPLQWVAVEPDESAADDSRRLNVRQQSGGIISEEPQPATTSTNNTASSAKYTLIPVADKPQAGRVMGLDPDSLYFVRVRLEDQNGVQSDWSKPVSLRTTEAQVPQVRPGRFCCSSCCTFKLVHSSRTMIHLSRVREAAPGVMLLSLSCFTYSVYSVSRSDFPQPNIANCGNRASFYHHVLHDQQS